MLRITYCLRNANALKTLAPLHQQCAFASKNNPNSWDYIPPHVGSHRKIWAKMHPKPAKITPKSRVIIRGRSNSEPTLGFPLGDEPILDPIVTKGDRRMLKRYRRVKDEVYKEEEQLGVEHHTHGSQHSKAGIPSPDAKYVLRAITKKANNQDENITRKELRTEAKYLCFESERHAISTLISRGFTQKFTLDKSGDYLITSSGHSFPIEHAKLSEVHLIQGEDGGGGENARTSPENESRLLLGLQVLEEEKEMLLSGVMEVRYEMLRGKEMLAFVNRITKLDATFFL